MWLNETIREEKKTFFAAFMGYVVDAYDCLVYTFLIPTLLTLWGMSRVQAGYIATGAI